MATTLLRTKLYRPTVSDSLVKRSQLIGLLDEGLNRKLTLVSAPAGFGKTTLVSEWIDKSGHPSAWLSLADDDNEPLRFLVYLINAVKQIDDSVGGEVLKILDASKTEPSKELLIRFADELGDISDNFTLVLDDYHVITNEAIHETVDFIIDYMPENMHLVMTTRLDPPLPLARLRVRSEMTEIRAADLRFSEAETSALLNDLMGLNLSKDEIMVLEDRTEGWIASLKLAALSLQGRVDKHDFIAAFSGNHSHLIDYLVDEVLLRQPPEIQSFLLKTSILSRMSAALCNHLLQTSTSIENLERLERGNLFVIQLDDEREWYRYHHLFADFLQQRLRKQAPQELPELHRRAARWLNENGFTHEAIGHAFAAGDVELAADIIDSISVQMVMDSQLVALLQWQSQLPEETVAARPWLCIAFAWCSTLTGAVGAVEPLLQKVESVVTNRKESAADDTEILGHVTTIRAFMARGMGDFRRAIEVSLEARKKLSQKNLSVWGALSLNLGSSYLVCGEVAEADRVLAEAADACQRAGNYYAAIGVISNQSSLQMIRGRVQEAAKIAQKAIDLGTQWGGGYPLPAAGFGFVGLGQVFYEWNNLSEAQSNLVRGLELGEKINEVSILIRGSLVLAKLRVAQGDQEGAIVALRRAQEIVPRARRAPECQQIDSWEMEIKLALGNLEEPAAWADKYVSQPREPGDYLSFRLDLALARVRLHQERPAEVLGILEPLLRAAESGGRTGDMIEILALTALAKASHEGKERAMDTLQTALELGSPEGYTRTFIDEGRPMAALLKEAVSLGICRDYGAKLLKQFRGQSAGKTLRHSGRMAGQQPLVAPLSDRELEVLALVAEGLKYGEIADNLFVSLNTIRTHSKNIYSKLGVDSRAKAIEKARELKLI